MPLRAVVFDMDGVLADTEPLHAAAYVRAFAASGVRIAEEDFRREVTIGGRTAVDWFHLLGGQAEAEQLYAAKDRFYAEVSNGRGAAREGLFPLVDDLALHGVAMVVATGARRAVAGRLLDALGLARRFAGVVGLEDVVRIKPDPEVYLKAVALVGVPPREAVAIEDVPKGIAAARAAGLVAVAAPTGATAALDFRDAHLVVETLSALSFARLQGLVDGREA
jgi:HAD superfamily hydrolase (TIGR01509 family)